MPALALTLAIFLFWTLVGQAVFCICRPQIGLLRSWLLSPALGLAVNVIGLMIGNQAGWGIGRFAWPMTAILGLAAALICWRRKIRVPSRAGWPYLAAVLIFLFWAGWPFLRFGFHWAAYVNDDYLNYSLAADRFRDFGFYRVPTVAELMGRDYTQYYWFMHVLELMRFGAEHTVAWTSALIGKPGVFAFMPSILALALTQIAAAAALVLHRGRQRRASQLTAGLLAIAPLFIFGSLYQLLAQAGGLALMLALLALLTGRVPARGRWRVLRLAIPTAIIAAALAVFYPEVSPFAVLALLICLAGEWLRSRRWWGARVVLLEYTLIGMIGLLRFNLIAWVYTLANQFVVGVRQLDLTLSQFPYFLIPSGFSVLFGFQPISAALPEPWSSILILAGAAFFVAVGVKSFRLAGRGEPIGCLLLVQLLVGFQLFRNGNDFGLYKLALYLQPALWGTLACLAAPVLRRRLVAGVAAVLFAGLVIPTGWNYAWGAADHRGAILTELQGASGRLKAPVPAAPTPVAEWTSGFDNLGAVKYAASAYRNLVDLRLLDREYFHVDFRLEDDFPLLWAYPHRDLYRLGHAVVASMQRQIFRKENLWGSEFLSAYQASPPSAYLALPSALGLFNKLRFPPTDRGGLFQVIPVAGASNVVCFVNSSRGNLYYLGDRPRIALFQKEGDPADPAGGVFGLGRFLLLRVDQATDPLYLRMMLTRSEKGPGRTGWSSAGRVLGTDAAPIPVVGAGAANVIVGPVHPVHLDGTSYIAIDFGEVPTHFPNKRTGLNALYHANIPLDYRLLIGFGRDISALSAAEVAALPRPRALTRFPQDLVQATGLEYSGIYEDGWVSARARVTLGESHPGDAVHLRGFVPQLPALAGGAHIFVAVNGRQYGPFLVAPGTFDWMLPVDRPGPLTRVEWRSPDFALLPGDDQRPIAGRIFALALEPAPASAEFNGQSGPRLPSTGVDADGWAQANCSVIIPSAAAASMLRLKLEYPGWPGVAPRSRVTVEVEGAPAFVRILSPGANDFDLPLPAGRLTQNVRITASSTVQLPAPDGRTRAFRLISAQALP